MAILHNCNLQSSDFDPDPGLFFYQYDAHVDFAAMGWVSAGRSRMRIPLPSSWPVSSIVFVISVATPAMPYAATTHVTGSAALQAGSRAESSRRPAICCTKSLVGSRDASSAHITERPFSDGGKRAGVAPGPSRIRSWLVVVHSVPTTRLLDLPDFHYCGITRRNATFF
jgi:hypothetical protein